MRPRNEPIDLTDALSSSGMSGVLGVGRTCIDRYITIEATGHRLNATKSTFRDAGLALGGSVPRILATCRSLGNATFLMTGAADDAARPWLDARLGELIDGWWIGDLPRTPDSIVVHDGDDELIEILSGRETQLLSHEQVANEGLGALARRGESDLAGLARPTIAVVDGRHPGAVAATRASFPDCHIQLDPGSSAVAIPSEVFDSLLALADLVYLSEDQARVLTDESDFREGICKVGVRSNATIVVTLGPRGAFVAHEGQGETAPPWPVKPRHSSIGAGDTFKGVVASALLQAVEGDHRSLTIETFVDAVALGLMGAAWRLDAPEVVPAHPTVDDLASFRQRSSGVGR